MKEGKSIVLRALVVFTFILLVFTIFYFFNNKTYLEKSIIGFAIEDNSVNQKPTSYEKIPDSYILILIILWVILLFFLMFIFIKEKKKINQEIINLNIPEKRGTFDTNVDLLYEVLQREGQLKVSTLAKAFKVKKEIILEWTKILESGDLVTIEYPIIGEAYVKPLIQEKENQEENEKKK